MSWLGAGVAATGCTSHFLERFVTGPCLDGLLRFWLPLMSVPPPPRTKYYILSYIDGSSCPAISVLPRLARVS